MDAEDAAGGCELRNLVPPADVAVFLPATHETVLTPRLRAAGQDPSAGKVPDDAVYSTLREIEDAGHKVCARLASALSRNEAVVSWARAVHSETGC